MRLNNKHFKIMRWTARVIALGVILFGLPFYFGYGNPLPFVNPDYSLLDNVWLTVFPLMFIGLALGWKLEKVGGYLVSISIILGLTLTLVIEGELVTFMLVPLISGILFIVLGHNRLD